MGKVSKLVVGVALFIFVLSGCGSNMTKTANGEKVELNENGVFHYAVSGEFAPFSFVKKDGSLDGFDVAVGQAIAKELGVKPKVSQFKFYGIISAVKTNRFDAAVASHTITPERKKSVNFSTPYYYSGPVLYAKPNSDIKDVSDLKGKSVAVSKGSTYEKEASKYTKDIAVYDSDVTALRALSDGKHDAVITDSITGKQAIKKGFKVKEVKVLGVSEQGIAVSKKDTHLLKAVNKALDHLRKTGKLKELSEKYVGADITEKP
ncbi:transporter substrate-binding domain-containing protein [Fictibacillus sp. Mic-4]|uniref:transporter substrate-binding domain-containing protein n=1 Tax=Fictibacillus TaxID=1329200 RepID=UPI000413E797|nr:transporter substrate-binding domain-containing protein [Fictibacillus gelatini]